ncbi:hypothetical protein RPMD05_62 [Rhodobacteraceae phage LS06-2018-MD05]|nr:hypothetical protein RPMD05_62 [Rhodobacteraceae phage LS06-2018-MD05]
MKLYIEKVKEQLTCNATKEYSNKFITYEYTNKQIDDNFDYFKYCKIENLSPYKSLLFFSDYLKRGYNITSEIKNKNFNN